MNGAIAMIEILRPTLILDKDVCQNNIETMALKAKSLKLRFRPHFKTHQSAKIGEWFKLFGVDSITVSSVQMAEYFASHGWQNITVAFSLNILEISNISRLAASIKLNVIVENKEAAIALNNKISSPIGIYIKIDTGNSRTGISPGRFGLIDAIIEIIRRNKHLHFLGFLTHAGQTYTSNSIHEVHSLHFDALLKMRSLKQRYIKSWPNIEVSLGDTPSATICDNYTGVDEIRPGNFVFYDLMQHQIGACSIDKIAIKLVCPVISIHPSRNEVVIYGGAIHLSKEKIVNIDGKELYGRVIISVEGEKVLLDSLNYVSKLSQEHGTIKLAPKYLKYLKPGDLVEIIPVHACLTANLMNNYYTTEGEHITMMPKY